MIAGVRCLHEGAQTARLRKPDLLASSCEQRCRPALWSSAPARPIHSKGPAGQRPGADARPVGVSLSTCEGVRPSASLPSPNRPCSFQREAQRPPSRFS